MNQNEKDQNKVRKQLEDVPAGGTGNNGPEHGANGGGTARSGGNKRGHSS